MKMWMIVTVETELEWPAQETNVQFMGKTLILRPPEGDAAPDVRLQYDHPQFECEAYATICKFLSVYSWWRRRPANARLRIRCTAPMRGGKATCGRPCVEGFQLPALAEPPDEKARIALALYREAGSVHGTPYEFLGYFKIINLCYTTGKQQIDWINKTLPLLTDRRAKARLNELKAAESDVGGYLYRSGRCAVAHAACDPMVDPDRPEDVFRLSADKPVVRALAEHLIEHELGVPWEYSE